MSFIYFSAFLGCRYFLLNSIVTHIFCCIVFFFTLCSSSSILLGIAFCASSLYLDCNIYHLSNFFSHWSALRQLNWILFNIFDSFWVRCVTLIFYCPPDLINFIHFLWFVLLFFLNLFVSSLHFWSSFFLRCPSDLNCTLLSIGSSSADPLPLNYLTINLSYSCVFFLLALLILSLVVLVKSSTVNSKSFSFPVSVIAPTFSHCFALHTKASMSSHLFRKARLWSMR